MPSSALVLARLSTPEDRQHFQSLGPVLAASSAVTSVQEQLADLAAQATVHGQIELASACSHLIELLGRAGVISAVA